MVEALVDLWCEPADARCITTNGIVNNGRLVMGGGTALQAAHRYPWLPRVWGEAIETGGNRVIEVAVADGDVDDPNWTATILIAFPTKNHYRDPSDMALIEKSARELMALVDKMGYEKVLLPRPGVGLGGLKWEDVKPVIEPILDDRVWVISNG